MGRRRKFPMSFAVGDLSNPGWLRLSERGGSTP